MRPVRQHKLGNLPRRTNNLVHPGSLRLAPAVVALYKPGQANCDNHSRCIFDELSEEPFSAVTAVFLQLQIFPVHVGLPAVLPAEGVSILQLNKQLLICIIPVYPIPDSGFFVFASDRAGNVCD